MKKVIYSILGLAFLILAVIGAILPIMPTVPFLLLSAICFSKSSKKVDAWFKNTKIYKKYILKYEKNKGMSKKNKIEVILFVTIIMGIAFVMMKNTILGRVILSIVWIVHMIYFIFGIKTIN